MEDQRTVIHTYGNPKKKRYSGCKIIPARVKLFSFRMFYDLVKNPGHPTLRPCKTCAKGAEYLKWEKNEDRVREHKHRNHAIGRRY